MSRFKVMPGIPDDSIPTSLDLSLSITVSPLSPSPLLISIDRYANKKKKNRNEVKGPSFRGIKYKKRKERKEEKLEIGA